MNYVGADMFDKKVESGAKNETNFSSSTVINNMSSARGSGGIPGGDIPLTLDRYLASFASDPNYETLWLSWRSEKAEFARRLQTVTRIYDSYTSHDEEHSAKIVENIENLLGTERIRSLSPTDAWLILMSAYSHDIGMESDGSEPGHIEKLLSKGSSEIENNDFEKLVRDLLEDSEMKRSFRETLEGTFYPFSGKSDPYKSAVNFWSKRHDEENDKYAFFNGLFTGHYYSRALADFNLILANYFRRHHAERSRDKLKRESFDRLYNNKLPRRLRLFLANIAYCHGSDWGSIYELLPLEDDGVYRDKVHPRFIAALLRLGDLLDVDSNRYNPFLLSAIQPLGDIPLAHFLKHHSVSELCVTPENIRIVARYSRSDVKAFAKRYCGEKSSNDEFLARLQLNSMRLMREWMNWVEADIHEFVMAWNNVAPPGFQGSIALKDKLDIYLDNHKINDDDLDLKYVISSSRASHIIEGSGLYSSPFVFIREIVQNAVDATKIHLFRVIQQEYQIKGVGSRISYKDFFSTIPKMLSEHLISVNFKITHKNENEPEDPSSLCIEIIDRGIGITRKKLNFMKHIGDINDEALKEENLMMPGWLRPTGDFGIGLQSVFLAVDTFNVKTKPRETEDEMQMSREIIFESTRRGGEILLKKEVPRKANGHTVDVGMQSEEEEKDVLSHFGTEVSIEIPFEDSFFWRRAFVTDLPYSNIGSDNIGVYMNFSATLATHLERYIMSTFTNGIIPIKFIFSSIYPGKDPKEISFDPLLLSDIDSSKLMLLTETHPEIDKKPYKGLFIKSYANTAVSVAKESLVFVSEYEENNGGSNCDGDHITLLLKPTVQGSGNIRLFYRGISIINDTTDERNKMLLNSFKMSGFDLDINIMCRQASDWLEINRERILPEAHAALQEVLRNSLSAFFDIVITVLGGGGLSEDARNALISIIDKAHNSNKDIWNEFALFRILHKSRLDLSLSDFEAIDGLLREKLNEGIDTLYFASNGKNVVSQKYPLEEGKYYDDLFSDFVAHGDEFSMGIVQREVPEISENPDFIVFHNKYLAKTVAPLYKRIIAFEPLTGTQVIKVYQVTENVDDRLIIDDQSYKIILISRILNLKRKPGFKVTIDLCFLSMSDF